MRVFTHIAGLLEKSILSMGRGSTLLVYRYDDEDYADGKTIHSRGDCFDGLTDVEKVVDRAIRAALPNGAQIRGNSIYTWESERLARRLWPYSRKRYLYELEIDRGNILFRGDLNWYSAAKCAVGADAPPEDAVERYCSGETCRDDTEPRIEILVSEAKVIRKLT